MVKSLAENNPDIKVPGSLKSGTYAVLNGADPFDGEQAGGDAPVIGLVTNSPIQKFSLLAT